MLLFQARKLISGNTVRLLQAEIERGAACSDMAVVKVVTERVPQLLSDFAALD
jgi:hypothetical protein